MKLTQLLQRQEPMLFVCDNQQTRHLDVVASQPAKPSDRLLEQAT
jgi:hypothetical protein